MFERHFSENDSDDTKTEKEALYNNSELREILLRLQVKCGKNAPLYLDALATFFLQQIKQDFFLETQKANVLSVLFPLYLFFCVRIAQFYFFKK